MVEEVTEEADTGVVDFMGDLAAPMEAVLVAIALGMASPAMVTGVAITVAAGTEEATTGEDVATIPITPTEDIMARLTSAITPITLAGTGPPSAIHMGGATVSGSLTITEGEDRKRRMAPCSVSAIECLL